MNNKEIERKERILATVNMAKTVDFDQVMIELRKSDLNIVRRIAFYIDSNSATLGGDFKAFETLANNNQFSNGQLSYVRGKVRVIRARKERDTSEPAKAEPAKAEPEPEARPALTLEDIELKVAFFITNIDVYVKGKIQGTIIQVESGYKLLLTGEGVPIALPSLGQLDVRAVVLEALTAKGA